MVTLTAKAQEKPFGEASALSVTVRLPLPARRLCGNGQAGKFARGRLVRFERLAAYYAGLQRRDELGLMVDDILWPTQRITLTAIVCRDPLWSARRLDDDNFWRGMKAQIDGLADAGFVMNDRQFTLGAVVWTKGEPLRGYVDLTMTVVE